MTVHEQALELVDLYALGALVGSELAAFEAHLARCGLCQKKLDRALTVTASLVPDSSPPSGVWPRIVTEIEGWSVVSP